MSEEKPKTTEEILATAREQGAYTPKDGDLQTSNSQMPPHNIDKLQHVLKHEALLNHTADFFERAVAALDKILGPEGGATASDFSFDSAKEINAQLGLTRDSGNAAFDMRTIQKEFKNYPKQIDVLIEAAERVHRHDTAPLTSRQSNKLKDVALDNIVRDLLRISKSGGLQASPKFGHALVAEAAELFQQVEVFYRDGPAELKKLGDYNGVDTTAAISKAMGVILDHKAHPEHRGPAQRIAQAKEAGSESVALDRDAHRSEEKGNTIGQVTKRVNVLTAKKIKGLMDGKTASQKEGWLNETLEKHNGESLTFEESMMKRREKKEVEEPVR